MAKPADTSKPVVATPPNANPTLIDYLKQPGPTAKPPVAKSKSTRPLPQNRRGNGGRKR